MVNTLEELAGEINAIVRGNRHVGVEMKDEKLHITLDLGIGVKGAEMVHFSPMAGDNNHYRLHYMGIYDLAFKTFLDEKRKDRIDKSQALRNLRNEAQTVKTKGEVEIHDRQRQEFYSQLFFPWESGLNYEETVYDALFLAKVFIEKAADYAGSV